ncbi:immunity 50 family protein [Cronobacter dublinensis]|uniref:Imm50 family immunity protein n=1 Tax=Cronobacter dublinensis TaxID=413497 RepID=UPI00292F065C|nr:Imm50 family immunity protein [Cronobacter dublinensis]WNY82976.1 immunity 50 family protein [Cronobacter dublinensis]
MGSWTDVLVDKIKVFSIFKEEEPSLYNIDIHEIIFHRDGPKITLRFNLENYPSDPPKKWVLQKFNTVQLQLTALDINEVKFSGWEKTNYNLDLNISKCDDLIVISARDDVFCLYIKASYLSVSSISAYTI